MSKFCLSSEFWVLTGVNPNIEYTRTSRDMPILIVPLMYK